MILGLSKLTIISNDVSDPEMTLKGVTSQDAQKIVNFLQKYAFRTYTEYRIAREKERVSKSSKDRNSKAKFDDVIDDDVE
jgi:hypothetical protein